MTLQLADGRKTFLDFREKAPLAATRQHVPRRRRQRRSSGSTTTGHLAVGVPGTVSGLETGARQVRHDEARRPDRAGDRAAPSRASSSTRATSRCSRPRPTAFKVDPATRRSSSRPAASRTSPATGWCRRTSRRRCARSARRAPPASTRARWRARIVASSQAGKGLITQADLDQLHDARAGAGRVRLPRLSRRLGAAAELGRRRHLRDPQRPRGLSAQGLGLPLGAGGARPDRGDAPRLRRPQQLSRRPGLRQEPARPPARQGLRGEDPRRDRPGEGGGLEGPEARRRAARRQQHDALLDRRRQGQRGRRSPTR